MGWPSGAARNQPNILLIVADQLRADVVGAHGSDICRTPRLDRVAAEGVRFDACIAPTPICSPARASILTGLYPHGPVGAVGEAPALSQLPPDSAAQDPDWWRHGIVYQVYPSSFQDSNGDGWGDLAGIRRRLDYVESLGVDAIWLNPIHPSPMKDHGYDVTDYFGVNPIFGSLADFDALLADVHGRGLRLLMDLVPNHTSDEHPWFVESGSSRENAKADWYVWRDGAPRGGPPNNWTGWFGSAWTMDPRRGQYYLHQFREQQPELNYRNSDVLHQMLDVMRFWLTRGVDGFRVDVISHLVKDAQFRDEPANPDYRPADMPYHSLIHTRTRDQPEVHDVIRDMRRVVDEYGGDRVMIGELDPTEHHLSYYGQQLDEIHLPFNFRLFGVPWSASRVRSIVDGYEAALPAGAWPNWVLGNHDQRRIASRIGQAEARVAHMMLLSLRGTPTCYFGDELGMTNVDVPPERLRDTAGFSVDEARRHARDRQWTPMRWDASRHAGFCPPGVEPWLPLGEDAATRNVAAQELDPQSMLMLFRALTRLRRSEGALDAGTYASFDAGDENVFAYERIHDASRLVIALNCHGADARARLGSRHEFGEVLLSTELDRTGPEPLDPIALRPHEGVVVRAAA